MGRLKKYLGGKQLIEFAESALLRIGSVQAMNELEHKDQAELLVVSDSHGNTGNLERIIRMHGAECDSLVFCGDGCADIGRILDKAAASPEFNRCMPPVIAFVQGNNDCDFYSCSQMQFQVPLTQYFSAAGHTVFMAHGHKHQLYFGMDALLEATVRMEASVCFFGHTHIAQAHFEHSTLLLNPGSCALPRGGQPCTFARVTLKRGRQLPDYIFYELTESGCTPFCQEYD